MWPRENVKTCEYFGNLFWFFATHLGTTKHHLSCWLIGNVEAEDVFEDIKNSGGKGRILQFDISNLEECKNAISCDMEKNGVYYGVICNQIKDKLAKKLSIIIFNCQNKNIFINI